MGNFSSRISFQIITLPKYQKQSRRSVLWLKVVLALWGFGVRIVLPFLPLHLASLGLTTEEISLTTGLITLIIMITTPIAGN